MAQWWDIPMLVTGGLFAGAALSIAWERIPAWRKAAPESFRADFAYTLRRVDRLQPALLAACLLSTVGFAVTAGGTARILAAVAAVGELATLAGSVAWLVPIQQRLVPSGPEKQAPTADTARLLARWSAGHVARTALSLAFLLLAVTAAAV
jgi:hypothetical protein